MHRTHQVLLCISELTSFNTSPLIYNTTVLREHEAVDLPCLLNCFMLLSKLHGDGGEQLDQGSLKDMDKNAISKFSVVWKTESYCKSATQASHHHNASLQDINSTELVHSC